MLALQFPECTKHLGPIVPGTCMLFISIILMPVKGTVVPNGVHVPGTQVFFFVQTE